MSISDDEAGRRVRFGATVAAVGHAFRIAGPAVFMAWAAIFAVRGVPMILELNHLAIPPLPFGPTNWSTVFPTVAATALVSGVLTRWLLNPTPASLRIDGGLAAYVGLMVAAYALLSLVNLGLRDFAIVGAGASGAGKTPADLGLRLMVSSLGSLVIDLVYAILALWPIGILTGERLPIGAAAARMRQAFFTYVSLYVLAGMPPAIFLGVRAIIDRGAQQQPVGRLIDGAFSTVAMTLVVVVLAQIYSRRVRACDLGETSSGLLREVFD